MKTVDIDQTKFQKWLQEQDPDLQFPRRNSCDCPVATYLRATKKAKMAQVGNYNVRLLGPGSAKLFQLPAWAVTFIRRFDIKTRAKPTARYAIRLLQGKGKWA